MQTSKQANKQTSKQANKQTSTNALLRAFFVVSMLSATAFAAGTWIPAPNPAGVVLDGGTQQGWDWEIDSKGNIWYSITRAGVYFQEKTGLLAPVKQPLPDSIIYDRVGVFVDQTTDSVYVGGKGGHIWVGKNGNWTEMAKIPLLPNLRNLGGFYQNADAVGDLLRDSKGRLIAITDSLAWWHDKVANTWKPIGTYDQYTCATWKQGTTGRGFLEYATLHKDGSIWASEERSLTRINPDLTVESMPCEESYNFRVVTGPSGALYGGTPGMTASFYRRKGPDYSIFEQIEIIAEGETVANNNSMGIYEDPSGYLWIGQLDRVMVWKDGIKLLIPTQGEAAVDKFLLSKDGDFWALSFVKNIAFRYSEKYAIPAEAISGSPVRNASTKSIGLRVQALRNAMVLETPNAQPWTVQISDTKGRLAWQGRIEGTTSISLKPGLWILVGRNSSAETIHKTIAVIE